MKKTLHDTMNQSSLPEGITLAVGGTGKTGRRVAERLHGLGCETRITSWSATPSFDWNYQNNWDAALGSRWTRGLPSSGLAVGYQTSRMVHSHCKNTRRHLEPV